MVVKSRVLKLIRILNAVEKVLNSSDDLRKPCYRGDSNIYAGHCYVVSESIYHLMGGKEAGFTPCFIKVEEEPHWFLRYKDGTIIDATRNQFDYELNYDDGINKGFLTKEPSKRAKELINRIEKTWK